MKIRTAWSSLTLLLIATLQAGVAAAAESEITVLNPRGIKPAIRQIPMAARPDTLDGKTIYIVDTKYPNTKPFVNELQRNLAEKYPATTWIVRDKRDNYMVDDPQLWAEIKERAHGAIVLIGH